MELKTHLKPRKSPRQARSKWTVDAIVEAAIQVLAVEGYARFTTARVAERAGVSVGTMYQYYPNKAALCVAVIDKCGEQFLEAFQGALAGTPGASLDDCIRALIDFAFVSPYQTPERHRAVLGLAPRLGVADRTEATSRSAARLIENALARHAAEISREIDISVAAGMIETTLEALAHRAVLSESNGAQIAELAREAARLLSNYLKD
jgi:AcrR family transcriptional regulator